MSLTEFRPLPDVGNVTNSSGTQQVATNSKPKKMDTNTKTGGSSSASSVFTQGATTEVSNITQDLLSGKFDIEKTLTNINQMIQKALGGVVKSKLLELLLGGNDKADAATAAAKTTTHVAEGAKILTTLQTKLLDGGINALQQLVTTGQVDLKSYADSLMNTMIQVGAEGCEAQVLAENNEDLNKIIEDKQKENEGLQAQMQDIMNKHGLQQTKDKDGNVSYQDKSGNAIDLESNPDLKGIIDKLNDNVKIISANVGIINTQNEIINKTTENADKLTAAVTQGIQDIAVKGENITQVAVNTAGTLIKEGLNEITNELMGNIGILQGDAVTAGINAGVDTAASVASTGLAAGIEAGTLGTGTSEAARVLANGVADGAAAVVRTVTGRSALGGIVTNLAAGQGVAQVLSNYLAQEATNLINNGIDNLVALATDSLTEQTVTQTEQTQQTQKQAEEMAKEVEKSGISYA